MRWVWRLHIEVIHFPFLEIAVTAADVMKGTECVPSIVGRYVVSMVGLCEETSHLLVFFQKTVIFLFQFADFDEGRR